MSFEIKRLENDGRKIVSTVGNFCVLEHLKDQSVAPDNAANHYFMSQMGVRRRQVVIKVDSEHSATVQAGSMQWVAGNVQATTGVKSAGDFLGKIVRGAVTNESAIKPEYVGNGLVVLEPTYKYIILQEVSDWGPYGMCIEDGMFLACDSNVEHKVVARSTLSSVVLGEEGLFNLGLRGHGVVALESNVPIDELIEVELNNDVLKIDGPNAIAWSADLDFTVERSSKTLLGSAVNQEGLVNVYRGTGKVLMSPITANTETLFETTHNKK